MRRVITIALAAALSGAAALLIRRLLERAQHQALPSGEAALAAQSMDRAPEPPADLSRDELYKEATRLGIKGRSKMNKRQLLEAVEARTGGSS